MEINNNFCPSLGRSLVRLVTIYGQRNWARVAKAIQSRNSKQCRERWQNVLSPNVKVKYLVFVCVCVCFPP